MTNYSNISLPSDIVFTTLMTLLMFTMKVPSKGQGWKATLQNVGFWVYVVYWIKTVGTIVRIPIRYDYIISRNLIMLWFNWTGCIIVNLSTIVPCQLYFHYRLKGNFVRVQHNDRFGFSVMMLVAHCLVFGATCAIIATDTLSSTTMLNAWRVFFFLSSFLEIFFLTACLYVIYRVSPNNTHYGGLKRHLEITLYMRFGLCTTIGLKILGKLPIDIVASIHLFIILTGLLGYHLKLSGFSLAKLSSVVRRGSAFLIENQGDGSAHRGLGRKSLTNNSSPHAANHNPSNNIHSTINNYNTANHNSINKKPSNGTNTNTSSSRMNTPTTAHSAIFNQTNLLRSNSSKGVMVSPSNNQHHHHSNNSNSSNHNQNQQQQAHASPPPHAKPIATWVSAQASTHVDVNNNSNINDSNVGLEMLPSAPNAISLQTTHQQQTTTTSHHHNFFHHHNNNDGNHNQQPQEIGDGGVHDKSNRTEPETIFTIPEPSGMTNNNNDSTENISNDVEVIHSARFVV